MNAQLSKKLKTLSFLLMFLIVFIHGFNVNVTFNDGTKAEANSLLFFIESFISDGICRIGVPMFFAISGYLASLKFAETFSVKDYFSMIGKRVNTLLIPYLSVSLLGILFVIALQCLPFSRSFFNNYNYETTSLERWFYILLLSPVPYQLWFIRFLMLYFLLYPIFYLVCKYFKLCGILFLIYFWSDFYLQYDLNLTKIEVEGALFFSVGIFAAIHQMDLRTKINRKLFVALSSFWLVWIGYRTSLLSAKPIDHLAVHYHLIGFTLLGFVLLWFAYDFFSDLFENNKWIQKNSGYAFGVFLFHEPILTIIKKLIIKSLNGTETALLIAYLVAPLVSFLFALWISRFAHLFIPKVYRLLTGNRIPVSGQP